MSDPIARFLDAHRAFAARGAVREADAAVLATADALGRPSARIVLVRRIDAEGFWFFTNYGSRKASELDANPHAALCWHWDVLEQQIRVEGEVARCTADESDRYFAARFRGSQIGAWASQQSRPLARREDLEAAVRAVEERFAGAAVPRPPHWGGYRLVPHSIEFWTGRDHRLHERELYRRAAGGSWARSSLQP